MMKQILLVAIAVPVLAFSFAIGAGTKPEENKNSSSAQHQAAVKKCRDDYVAAVHAAKGIKDPQAQQKALNEAKRVYDDCLKWASKVH